MIREKDVVRMKVPFPSISSELAKVSHMYVCKSSGFGTYEYIKCQTYNPLIEVRHKLKHYYVENVDIARNPFSHKTLIDCDKLFYLTGVLMDDGMKTTVRSNVCDELFQNILTELNADGYRRIVLDSVACTELNDLVTLVEH